MKFSFKLFSTLWFGSCYFVLLIKIWYYEWNLNRIIIQRCSTYLIAWLQNFASNCCNSLSPSRHFGKNQELWYHMTHSKYPFLLLGCIYADSPHRRQVPHGCVLLWGSPVKPILSTKTQRKHALRVWDASGSLAHTTNRA